jgi:opacity protein-like surface antigen
MKRYLAAAAALSLGATPVAAASSTEPVRLTDQELDEVTAGKKYNFIFNLVFQDVTLTQSPVNMALVLQVNAFGTAIQQGSATAVQSVAQNGQNANLKAKTHRTPPGHGGR